MGAPPTGVATQEGFMGLDSKSSAAGDIEITAGKCKDSTGANVGTGVAMTKRPGVAWAAGDTQGGLLTGSVLPERLYYVYALIKDSDASLDYGTCLATDAISTIRPAGYSKHRLVDFFFTDAASAVAPFVTVNGVHWNLHGTKSIIRDFAAMSNTYSVIDMSAKLPPSNVVSEVLLGGNVQNITTDSLYISFDGTAPSAVFQLPDNSWSDTNASVWGGLPNSNSDGFLPNAPMNMRSIAGHSMCVLLHAARLRR
jgi:hypothetical protein